MTTARRLSTPPQWNSVSTDHWPPEFGPSGVTSDGPNELRQPLPSIQKSLPSIQNVGSCTEAPLSWHTTAMSNNTTPHNDWNSSDYPSQPYPQNNQPSYPYGPAGSSPSPSDNDQKGFFGSLFDMSFNYYVTPKIAKIVYILTIICGVAMWIGAIITAGGVGSAIGEAANDSSGGSGVLVVFAILLGWIPAFLFIIGVRMQIEFVLALIKTSENTSALRRTLNR